MRISKDAAHILLVAFLFSSTASVFAPLQIYLTNRLELALNPLEILMTLVPLFLGILAAITIFLGSLRARRRDTGRSLVFAISVLLWIQGNVFVWDYGLLDGHAIDWSATWLLGLIDGAVWIAGIAWGVWKAGWVSKRLVTPVSICFICMQSLHLSILLASAPAIAVKHTPSNRNKYSFSIQKNVILIVLDTFQSDVFQELIDEDASLASIFKGFVYFRNAVGGFRESYPSIPNILTATYFDNSAPMQQYLRDAYLSDSSLPKLLIENDYRVDVFSSRCGVFYHPTVVSNIDNEGFTSRQRIAEVAFIEDMALFRYLPHWLKMHVYNNQRWLLSRWARRLREKRTEPQWSTQEASRELADVRFVHEFLDSATVTHRRNAFKFYHLKGLHPPLRMTRDLEYEIIEETRDGVKEVARGVLKLVGIVLSRLDELGLFDSSMVFVLSDHGIYAASMSGVRVPDEIVKRYGNGGNVDSRQLPESKGVVLPLVLAKRHGATGELLICDAPVSLSDIPKTIASELGLANDGFPGMSMFNSSMDAPRERRVLFSTFRRNPPYSSPYRSTMHEFIVSGFSWLDSSWTKTGRVYEPAESTNDSPDEK